MPKNTTYLFVFFSFFFFSVQISNAQIDMAQVRKDIEVLTSKEFFGRGYLQKGDRKASEWIAKAFEQYGLKKYGKDYFQSFPLAVNTFPQVELSINGQNLEVGKDFIVQAASVSGKGKAQVYWFDSLVFSDPKTQQRFLGENLEKNIIAYPDRFQNQFQKLPLPCLQKLYSAQGFMVLKKKLTMTVSAEQNMPPTFEVLIDSLPKNIEKIQFRLDAQVLPNYVSQNVIGYIEGTKRQDSCLVVSAHYDHLGGLGKEVYFAGANDNASGIAMLLALARYYQQNPPPFRIVFMAFGGEEAGLIGSQYYVKNPFFPLSQIKFLINLDLAGTGDTGATAVNGAVFIEEFERLRKINSEKQFLPKIDKRGKAANSDHYFFTEKGVKSFFIYLMGGIQAYHDVYDRPETLPLTKFEGYFGLLTEFLGGF